MIGLDTNVIVRYLVQDDPKQAALATRAIEQMTGDERGFVSLVVVIELYWVLTSVFGLQREQFVTALESLLRVREIAIERAETVAQTLRMFARSNADFADCLIERTAAAAGCERTITFDRGASKNCGMTLLG